MHYQLAAAVLSSSLWLQANAQEVAPEDQFPETPLSQKRFQYDQLPYQVDTDVGLIRGVQHGYNICNSTTQNQESSCQTAIVNSIEDFCIWSAPEPNSEIGSIEGEAVAWCTKPDHGTRLIPEGALKGLQFTKTPDYRQIVGFIDQTKINLTPEDFGGEMDPHGADLRGNPMGGLVFSNAFTGQYTQVVEWHNFVGGDYFCMKVCDPAGPDAAKFCEHIFDRIGCAYNAPSEAKEGEYTSCDGENQLFPGVYVEGGATLTYTQPPESLGAISSMPYTAAIPASSNCQTYTSAALLASLPTSSGAAGSGASSAAPTGSASRSGSSSAGGAAASSSSAPNAATATTSQLSLQLAVGTLLAGVAIGFVQIL